MILAAVREFLVKNAFAHGRIVAAVSGGADSTALLVALAELRDGALEVVCAHVNHRLRGSESDADEAFVRDLCARLDVQVQVADGTLDDVAVRARGIEAAAREVRYRRLGEIRDRTGARLVATAHQKNDQAETVLMRLLAGSGIAGLRGIHPFRDDGFIRPLLNVSRSDIDAFLRERNIRPRHDRSNEDPRFLRNRVDALASAAAQARAMWPLLDRAVDEAERACAVVREDETRFTSLPDDEWLRGAMLQRHIRRLDPAARDYDAQRIAREAPSLRRADVTATLELVREGDGWLLRQRPRLPAPPPDFEVALTPESPAVIAEGVSVFVAPRDRADEARPERASGQVIQLPAGAAPTFTVRSRRAGDRFHPLGMANPKKLKDFLIDRKVAADLRDRLPLVVWNGEIVWIAGVEVSERVKCSSAEAGDLYELWIA
jgi:tRNA(Ile)-lysidine synthase